MSDSQSGGKARARSRTKRASGSRGQRGRVEVVKRILGTYYEAVARTSNITSTVARQERCASKLAASDVRDRVQDALRRRLDQRGALVPKAMKTRKGSIDCLIGLSGSSS
jgi:hypothetical protein